MAVNPLAIGSHRIGGSSSGSAPATIVPTPADTIAYDVQTNDRYQLVLAVTNPLDPNGLPQWLYWSALPPPWAEYLAEPQPDDVPAYYATDEGGIAPVPGANLELHAVEIKNADEVECDQLVVEFVPRPAAIGAFDGGLDPSTVVGFTAFVQGWGLPAFVRSGEGFTSGVAVSDFTFSASISAGDIASDLWPNVMTVQFPMRFTAGERVIRASILNVRFCEIRRVYITGKHKPPRKS